MQCDSATGLAARQRSISTARMSACRGRRGPPVAWALGHRQRWRLGGPATSPPGSRRARQDRVVSGAIWRLRANHWRGIAFQSRDPSASLPGASAYRRAGTNRASRWRRRVRDCPLSVPKDVGPTSAGTRADHWPTPQRQRSHLALKSYTPQKVGKAPSKRRRVPG